MSLSKREQIALALRALARQGFFALPFGHLSVRSSSPDEGPILILRHLHGEARGFADVSAADVVTIGADGEPLGGVEVPGERYLHSAVYARRRDVNSVLHYHSTLTAAFGLFRHELVPRTPLAPILAPAVRTHGYGGQIDTPAKGADLCESLGDYPAVLLPGHGAVVVGTSVEEVSARAVALEDCCRVELAAAQIAAPRSSAESVGAAGSSEVAFVLWHDLVRGMDVDGG